MHLLLRHKPRFLADIKNRLVKPPNSGEKKKKNTAKTFLTLKKNTQTIWNPSHDQFYRL